MAQPIEYQKVMTEIVYINLPGPSEPAAGMTGGELLHGFLSDLYECSLPPVKEDVLSACERWNVVFRHDKR
jgi:hypothetical protein